uniref:NADH-ubiquinone oxidoreductase chain 5 n=1 Tax=Nephus oblongosignatus TaxID=2772058 RepID=A0A7H1DNN6_9CUCU|nr:NADH dehydrogenase subunit 5 [Nephus oblongosignatus]QNS38581.1 NADH dehydrogenase subunit 5 [Nephus oblongosignatus]
MICLIFSFFFFSFSMILFFQSLYFLMMDLVYFLELVLISINSSSIEMTLLLDWMSLMFMSFVFFISSMVIFYSKEYMMGDLNLNRFIMLVVMFVFSMMFLIISPNLISILLGWDGLGLVSYCLVIYYQNVKSYNAGMLTALSNRIGDVMLLIGIAWMLNYGSWNFIFYFDLLKFDDSMFMVGLMVFIAALTKSAQIPFSSWLPAAMAAPTPVSALVHSSTLVTAGVYLLIRFNVLINGNFSLFLLILGLLTMFMSGLGANMEFDLKKIIALSTLSQLGLMMSILSLGGVKLAFYHLLIHALFKALLFMCAGNIIHSLMNCQDIRYMGSLLKLMPLTLTFFNLSNLSLCGLPFFSGFYSKDLVVEFLSFMNYNFFIYFIFYFSIGLTVSYSFRLVYYSLLGNFNFFSLSSVLDSSKVMLMSMSMMMFMVIFSGSMLNWMIFLTPYMLVLPFIKKILTLLIIILSIMVGLEISKMNLSSISYWLSNFLIFKFFSSMWNLTFISTLGVNFYLLKVSNKMVKFLDQGWLEYLGSQNLYKTMKFNSSIFNYLFKNNIKIFMIFFISWLFILMFI